MEKNTLREIVVSHDYAGKRADVVFSEVLSDLTRSQIRKLINRKLLLIEGKPFKPSKILAGGEHATVKIPTPEPIEIKPEKIEIACLYEDKDILVVDKPAGMIVHPGAGVRSATLVNAILFMCKDLSGIGGKIRPGIVHRLDKDTSGVIVVAKNDFAHQALVDQFKNRLIKKEYLAIVSGVILEDSGTFSTKIGRHVTQRKRMSSNTRSGRESVTYWEVIRRYKFSTYIKAYPKTGRTHQIRVHFSEEGFPLIGDSLYGFKKKSSGLFKKVTDIMDRHALHAHKIEFSHPRTNSLVEFVSPVPEDFGRVLDLLESCESTS